MVEALLDGPKAPGLVRPLPEGVALGAVQLGQDGTAYVDLRSADHPDPPPGGSTEEIQRVYSLVDSIALNVPQASPGRAAVERRPAGDLLGASRPLSAPGAGPRSATTVAGR